MHTDNNFLAKLLADPADDSTRLVYADWLDDQGEPASIAKAEFLRLTVQLSRDVNSSAEIDLQERLQQLAAGVDTDWLAGVGRLPFGNFPMMPLAGWQISRTKPLRKTAGVAIPAFIHNGNYYLTALDVYADGVVDCWGCVDLALFRQKVATGWVVTRPPVGSRVSIHNLGLAQVVSADWEVSTTDVVRQVEEAVRQLNPEGTGLIDMGGTDTEVRNRVRYAKLGLTNETPYRLAAGREVSGKELPVFLVEQEKYRLLHWFVYADGQAQIGYGPVTVKLELLSALFQQGRLTTSVPDGALVQIDGLGRFRASEGNWFVEPGERIREAIDCISTLNGSPDAVQRCIAQHEAYEQNPGPEQRELLRQAYEAVPAHLRMYCGDMDSKDWPIRRILGLG
jgi:uncharacterized protein (TIGR02996 family)